MHQTLMGICVSLPLRQKASPSQSLHFKTALVSAALRYIASVCLLEYGMCVFVCVYKLRGTVFAVLNNKKGEALNLLSSLSPCFLIFSST